MNLKENIALILVLIFPLLKYLSHITPVDRDVC